jgi:type I restriction enzyme S subunit
MEPKVRFKGFEGEWIYLPFSEIAERTSVSEQAGILPGVEFEDIVSGEGSFNKNIYQKDCHKFGKVFHKGDILFGKLRPYLKNIILADFKGVAIGDFWILRSKDFDTEYLYTLINSDSFLDVANISSGSKMPRADWNLVSTTKFIVTSNKEEQQSIGTYFRTLDAKLQASAKKVDSLKKLKSASLVAMFPQQGETTPKVRFKGFEGEWKIKSFKELYKRSSIKNDLTYDSSKIISVANMYFKEDNMNTDETYLLTYNVMKLGDIAFEGNKSKSFAHGRFVENSIGNGIVSHVFVVFSPLNEDYDIDFWKYYINNEQVMGSKLVRCTKSSTMMTDLVVDDFLKETILVPSLEEQQELGRYFATLDLKIALETDRLEKLKQIKLACLDKMFV